LRLIGNFSYGVAEQKNIWRGGNVMKDYSLATFNEALEYLKVLQVNYNNSAKRHGFWDDYLIYGEKVDNMIICRKLCLIHSEVSDALEELRKTNYNKSKFGEELADIIIKTLDLSEEMCIDLPTIMTLKKIKNDLQPRLHNKRF
jgi:NTP pyrophosphatase (non-canonical NTP hydrolase)